MSGVRSLYTRGRFFDSLGLDPRIDNVVSTRIEHRHKVLRGKLAMGVGVFI